MNAFRTKRLHLRPFRIEDIAPAYEWFSDPAVMRFTPTGPDPDLLATQLRVTRYIAAQGSRGFSKWIVFESDAIAPIGDAGIMWLSELNTFELGFRLRADRWGRGYATELATAWIAAAPTLAITELSAFTHVDNSASQSVLKKTGFVPAGREIIMDMDSLVFRRSI